MGEYKFPIASGYSYVLHTPNWGLCYIQVLELEKLLNDILNDLDFFSFKYDQHDIILWVKVSSTG